MSGAMIRFGLLAGAVLALAACGKHGPLEPPAGVTPPKPIWETQAPPADTPANQPPAAQPKA
ncbi:hypothetical protein [Parapedomonas caeni]